MNQRTMFGEFESQRMVADPKTIARKNDPVTSKAAAKQIEASGSGETDRVRANRLVIELPGRTCGELAQVWASRFNVDFDTAFHTLGRRLADCRRFGLIRNGVDSEEKIRQCNVKKTRMQLWYPCK